VVSAIAVLPPSIVLDPLLRNWLLEDIGRGDRTTQGLLGSEVCVGQATWIAKEAGVIAGLPIALRVFQLLNQEISCLSIVPEGTQCQKGQVVVCFEGSLAALLMGERVALNLVMRLSGIATETHKYV
jgi:nicotinate-nucleotide pyrophosphorylase (carboxylating)